MIFIGIFNDNIFSILSIHNARLMHVKCGLVMSNMYRRILKIILLKNENGVEIPVREIYELK